MSELTKLPVILVSAKSEAAASHFISELIDNETTEASGSAGRVWRIVNKYYSADVRLLPAPDAPAPSPDPDLIVEGHIIYLAEDECCVEAGERREGAGAGAGVRVLAAEAARLPAAVRAWAARRRLEPVPLHAAPGDEPHGVQAVRAALHAHVWPGLRRADGAREPRACRGGGADSDSEEEEDGAGAVERAELWAAALGSLDGVRALPPPERRAAAEALVTAFCRALGHDLDAL